MPALNPATIRREELLKGDLEAFTLDGQPLSHRQLTTVADLRRLIENIGRVMDVLPNVRHFTVLDNTLLAARLAVDAHVLPPYYLKIRLKNGFVVESNDPLSQRPIVHRVRDAGEYAGKQVAAHHIGLALHRTDGLVYFSALAPNTRTTVPVVIGIPYDQLEGRVELHSTAQRSPYDLLDPRVLLGVAPTGIKAA